MNFPVIIQGGMGTGVSSWILANTVASAGQLGVVSGTAIDNIFIRRLQLGDPGGNMRRALEHFPFPDVARRLCNEYFIDGGKSPDKPFKTAPKFELQPSREIQELFIVSNFCEVWLAKEGHAGVVGINLMEKIQIPNIFSLYGAMLAGVDYVLMGAGIPRDIPGVLDSLAEHRDTSLRVRVEGASMDSDHRAWLRPRELFGDDLPPVKRPLFLAIVASAVLAKSLARKATGRVDGFVVETPWAGGHNAPPRGQMQLTESGEPIYGEKDNVDLADMKAIGLPFWIAGKCADPVTLQEVRAAGAQGIQVGTLFAFSEESAMDEAIKTELLAQARRGECRIFTDPLASPTGFPFKVAQIEGTNSQQEVYLQRMRVCDLGYLRTPFIAEDGGIEYRCPAEPEKHFIQKGGAPGELPGRKCLCNGLLANIGLPQKRGKQGHELPLVTAGDDLNKIAVLTQNGKESYSALDVIRYLLGEDV
ncbi:nitronate monooxygenase [Candidatus Sumerlaeota bacterium]|nr:nitronate monooxygenase [Candidatus Sumerlaeota bacterium]